MAGYLSTTWINGLEVVKLRNQKVYVVIDPTLEQEVFRGSKAAATAYAEAHTADGVAAEADGYAAYREGRPPAPWASQVVRDITAGMPVGSGAAEIFRLFNHGWLRASQEAAAAVLAE